MVVRVFIDREELVGFTSLRLSRKKEDLTGSLTLSVFMNYLPTSPVMVGFGRGKEIFVYIEEWLVFTGSVDRRKDTAIDTNLEADTEGNGGGSLNIGPDQYTVQFTARGSTKYLIDSSHQHPTGTMLKPTSKEVFENLIAPWGIELEWLAETETMDKLRLRDGGRVVDEIQRVSEQHSLYVYETKEGKLRVTDKPPEIVGEPLVLGRNILQFSTDQLDDQVYSEVVVKGQRIEKEVWGEEAVINTQRKGTDKVVPNFRPINVQLYGNATPELLEKRAQYEVNKRAAKAQQISLDVFHVQQTNREPWDLGVQHYVEIPPAGIAGYFEVIELLYDINANGTLKTNLTLSPTPAPVVASGSGAGFLGGVRDQYAGGVSSFRGIAFGLERLNDIWKAPELTITDVPSIEEKQVSQSPQGGILSDVKGTEKRPPPLKLPSRGTT